MAPQVRSRVRNVYNEIRREHQPDYNPIEKRLSHIHGIENVAHIDELLQDETDAPNGNGKELQAAQQVIAHMNQLQIITTAAEQPTGGFCTAN
jgi:hypothetical protein